MSAPPATQNTAHLALPYSTSSSPMQTISISISILTLIYWADKKISSSSSTAPIIYYRRFCAFIMLGLNRWVKYLIPLKSKNLRYLVIQPNDFLWLVFVWSAFLSRRERIERLLVSELLVSTKMEVFWYLPFSLKGLQNHFRIMISRNPSLHLESFGYSISSILSTRSRKNAGNFLSSSVWRTTWGRKSLPLVRIVFGIVSMMPWYILDMMWAGCGGLELFLGLSRVSHTRLVYEILLELEDHAFFAVFCNAGT